MSAALASPAAAARSPNRRATSRLPHLLDAAARAFAERGFAAASVRDIVGPVGMLPGSLYCHFATKEALLAAVYREGVERIGAAVDAAVAPPPSRYHVWLQLSAPTRSRRSIERSVRRASGSAATRRAKRFS